MATWADIKSRVQYELDLIDEDFISASELLYFCNRAINTAESLILNLSEDYFLTKETLSLVSGTQEYDLPTGIYAQKIRKLIYSNGARKFLIRRIKRLEETASIQYDYDYKYVITNSLASGLKITFYPTPNESGDYVTIWHLRNARTITADTDEIDIPEAEDYITQFIKDQCINKERMTPDAPKSQALQEQESILIESLTERVPDEDTVPEMDLSFYYGVN